MRGVLIGGKSAALSVIGITSKSSADVWTFGPKKCPVCKGFQPRFLRGYMIICPARILLNTFHIFQSAGEQFCAVPRRFRFGTFCPKVKARSVSTGPQPMGSLRKPSEAGCVGRGGARERVPFSPQGGNGTKRTLRRRGFGEAPQQAFWQAFLPHDGAKISSVFTLELLAKNASVATLALLAVSAYTLKSPK